MRLIDGKGKIFGLINIFDFLFIALILALLFTSSIFYYNRYKDKRGHLKKIEKTSYRHIYKYVKAKSYLISEVADRVKKGESFFDSKGNIIWEVVDIVSNNPACLGTMTVEDNNVQSELVVDKKQSYYLKVFDSNRNISLGHSMDILKGKIKLSSFRRVEISLKLLCKVERDGKVKVVVNSSSLAIGRKIAIDTPKYYASFTITDIIQDETR